MNIYEKLSEIQAELKVSKDQFNGFGKYKYRSCEDIIEAVKPICKKHKAVLLISDELVNIGERYYIKTNTELIDLESDTAVIKNNGYAREELSKKGMDGSQITGTASSYARKYALNGLFCIDDTKDADTNAYKEQEKAEKMITAKQKSQIIDFEQSGKDLKGSLKYYGFDSVDDMTEKRASELIAHWTKQGE